MRLDQEAQEAEAKILGHAKKIKDVATLKRILHESLTTFEDALDALPESNREEALSLYLDKIRKVTFSFHYVILRKVAERELAVKPSPSAMQTVLARHGKSLQKIARLYRFI